jgi:8-oxo-dGTP pyrophosphatase MutT (NUDIX family)
MITASFFSGIRQPWLLVSLAFLTTRRVLSLQSPNFIRSNTRGSVLNVIGGADAVPVVDKEGTMNSQNSQCSLISSFLVDVSQEQDGDHVWSLTPIDDVIPATGQLSSGARSWQALDASTTQQSSTTTPQLTLKSRRKGNTIEIEVSSNQEPELVLVLSRVLAQYTAQNATENESWTIVLFAGSSQEEILSDVTFSTTQAARLFGVDESSEIVDMVDQQGNVLGMVPRGLVHKWNILHRGIGLTVSKDKDFSELYCHRRTDFKRIFPSLYDMFVGGVSGSGEDSKLTAAREVAEELGLSGALDKDGQPNHAALSDPLFKCVVCTSYNRCVVTVFQYTIQDPVVETISWQEEEVSWGNFVPIDIVEAAADLSIQRLVAKGEWPGMMPATQSKWKGSKPPNSEYENEDWMNWDFVPDGLLVWEAWLKWRQTL